MPLLRQYDVERLCQYIGPYLFSNSPSNVTLPDEKLIDFAVARHRVGPILYNSIKNLSAFQQTETLKDKLQSVYHQNCHKIMLRKAVERNLHKCLDANSIDYRLVKGLALSKQLYADPSCRVSRDVDLLVAPANLEAALDVLLEQGYSIWDTRSKKILGLNFFGPTHYANCFKDITLEHSSLGIQVELHQRLFHLEPKGLTLAVFNSTCDKNTPVLTAPHYLLYLILHGALVYWPRLKMILDLALLVQKTPIECAHQSLAIAHNYGADAAFVASLEFVEELFPNQLTKAWMELIDNSNVPRDDRERFKQKFRHTLMNDHENDPQHPPKLRDFWKLSKEIFPKQISQTQLIYNQLIGSLVVRI